jgi:NADPH:quinone reductase
LLVTPICTRAVFGVSVASTAKIESREFFATGGTRLYGLTVFHELMSVERAGIGLRLLAELIAADKLRPQVAVEAQWGEIGVIAQRLINRDFAGKAVLHI